MAPPDDVQEDPDRRPPPTRPVKSALQNVARRVVHGLGPVCLRSLARTWRMTVLGDENLARAGDRDGAHFIALWHGRMLLGLPHHAASSWHVLVSGSQDGDIAHALLARCGYRVIRGSTSRGGARALREMLAVLEKGTVLAITPDGPRGPRHSVNPGLAWMARATGHPILPVGFACDRAWRARSWDRFTIPRPWARVVMTYGEPVRVDPSASDADLAAAAERIHEALMSAEQRSFEFLHLAPDW
ncbi:MAG TPA: lysophospholipid acyltransferase family protein [Planctomycetota bacterium]|nr:lysophospholipid acyltransferase family protein [Planctomycetota bacterium]